MTYVRPFELRWSDVDANGHVQHTTYAQLGVHVRMAFFADAGFGWERFQALGFGPVLLREELDYLRELRMGERVTGDLEAAALSPDAARWRIRHTIRKEGGEIAGRVLVAGGFIDLARRKLVAPPPGLAARLREAPRAPDFEELRPLRRREG